MKIWIDKMFNLDWEKLGGRKELSAGKGIELFFYLCLVGIMFYASIGASPSQQMVLYFYIAMLTVSTVFIVIDLKTSEKELDYLDSVTVEDDAPLSPKKNLLIGAIGSLILLFFIATTGQAFVDSRAPFGVTFSTLNNSFGNPVGNALLSGIFGVSEVIFFFSTVYPSLHSTIFKKTDSMILALVGGILSISLIFLGFHGVVYKSNESALLTVFFFGSCFQALPILLMRNSTISKMLHFTNNFAVILFSISKFSIFLVI